MAGLDFSIEFPQLVEFKISFICGFKEPKIEIPPNLIPLEIVIKNLKAPTQPLNIDDITINGTNILVNYTDLSPRYLGPTNPLFDSIERLTGYGGNNLYALKSSIKRSFSFNIHNSYYVYKITVEEDVTAQVTLTNTANDTIYNILNDTTTIQYSGTKFGHDFIPNNEDLDFANIDRIKQNIALNNIQNKARPKITLDYPNLPSETLWFYTPQHTSTNNTLLDRFDLACYNNQGVAILENQGIVQSKEVKPIRFDVLDSNNKPIDIGNLTVLNHPIIRLHENKISPTPFRAHMGTCHTQNLSFIETYIVPKNVGEAGEISTNMGLFFPDSLLNEGLDEIVTMCSNNKLTFDHYFAVVLPENTQDHPDIFLAYDTPLPIDTITKPVIAANQISGLYQYPGTVHVFDFSQQYTIEQFYSSLNTGDATLDKSTQWVNFSNWVEQTLAPKFGLNKDEINTEFTGETSYLGKATFSLGKRIFDFINLEYRTKTGSLTKPDNRNITFIAGTALTQTVVQIPVSHIFNVK